MSQIEEARIARSWPFVVGGVLGVLTVVAYAASGLQPSDGSPLDYVSRITVVLCLASGLTLCAIGIMRHFRRS